MKAELRLELYRKLFLIRTAEEHIREHYNEDEMRTPMHMSMGGEAIAAGVCQALEESDQILTTYRSHAGFLAKTGNIEEFFYEMYAREPSSLKGKGGSMHLCLPGKGFLGTSAIVAAHIPVAVGCAWANRMKDNKKIVAVFFGDGAADEGVFWESINAAALMQLPVIFICEDNGLAVHTSSKQRRGYDSIAEIVAKFRCGVFTNDSTDVEEIYAGAAAAITKMRAIPGPFFFNLKYYRYLEHVGINYDFDAGYRKKDEFDEWYARDPVLGQRRRLIDAGWTEVGLNVVEQEINDRVVSAIMNAKKAAMSNSDELYKGVFK